MADSSSSGQPIHLWQFLRELLLKPHNYGRCIRWLNKEKGIFKIEDSAHVARLWGLRKNRPAMNYDKLSRSIRQYYKKGIIRKPDVSQRLVYQFVHPVWGKRCNTKRLEGEEEEQQECTDQVHCIIVLEVKRRSARPKMDWAKCHWTFFICEYLAVAQRIYDFSRNQSIHKSINFRNVKVSSQIMNMRNI